jgi:NAD(P)-dependent dehydrogenase (short-subunit alcohol dehydrogenase family)
MKDLADRVAVVTGAGSGIGAGIARALAAERMRVVVADIEEGAARAVAGAIGKQAIARRVDVASLGSLRTLAEDVDKTLGGCQLLCANAGVLPIGRLDRRSDDDWRWGLSVNLFGTIHSVDSFLPLLRRDPANSHIVITASMAGLLAAGPGKGVYNTTKHAQMAYGETLRVELAAEGIGVTLLLPAGTESRIVESARNRPAELGAAVFGDEDLVALRQGVAETAPPVSADYAVRNLVRGIRENATWVVTHNSQRPLIEARFKGILAAFDAAEN